MPLVHKAYKFRFYPTPEQEAVFARLFGALRFVYNKALELKTESWNQHKKTLKHKDVSRLLTSWKAQPELAFLREHPRDVVQKSLLDLDQAYVNFFANRCGYPKFQKRRSKAVARYPRNCFKVNNQSLKLRHIPGSLNVRWSQDLPSGMDHISVAVMRDGGGKWWVVFEGQVSLDHLETVQSAIGVDLGIETLAALSTGEKIPNPNHLKKNHKRLAKAQRRLSRKKRGSANRRKAARKVARVHAKIADARKDHLHKLSTRLVRENQTVAVETLNVKGMVKNRKLSRAISDASWSELTRQLEYKCRWYGREFVKVDRWLPSSKTCSSCGHKMETMPLKVRRWECPGCGTVHDRDVNASRNILAAGLAVSACGGEVRPEEPMVPTAEPVKQERKGATPELPGLWA